MSSIDNSKNTNHLTIAQKYCEAMPCSMCYVKKSKTCSANMKKMTHYSWQTEYYSVDTYRENIFAPPGSLW